MESLLVIVAAVSLALAAIMSTVAWRLLRDRRVRTTNRAEALIALLRPGDSSASARAGKASSDEAGVVSHAVRRTPTPPPPDERDEAPTSTTERRTAIEEPRSAIERRHAPQSHAAAAVMDAPLHDRPRMPEVEIESWDRTHVDRSFGSDVAGMFASDEPRHMSLGRWLGLGIAGLVVLAGAGTVYALNSGTWLSAGLSSLTSFGDRDTTVASSARQPLELLSLKHTTDQSGTFIVTGLVQNPADGATLRGVVATVYLFDPQGRYFASGRARLDVPTLGAGEDSPFVVKIPQAAVVARYRVGFRLDDGGVVAHVDRRGQTPAGTTGDTTDDNATPSVVAPAATPRRSEGRP
jgi:hypothetical protein